MPAASPPLGAKASEQLRRLGARLRQRRKHLKISATATAEAAGMSRQTLYRIEVGEPSVAIGAWLNAVAALGLELDLRDPSRATVARRPPKTIRPADFPQLGKLAWQLKRNVELSPEEALALYERNWRHVDVAALSAKERDLLDRLLAAFGRERLIV